MGVTKVHNEYIKRIPEWSRIADVLSGRDAIIAGGQEYLPMLESHRRDYLKYRAYQSRGIFYNATALSHQSYLSAIFRRDPTLQLSGRTEHMRENITGVGDNFYTFAKTATGEVLGKGRYGLMLDRPRDGGAPYVVGYCAEQIRNWRLRRVDGQLIPDQVVLSEYDEVPAADGFGVDSVLRYRVLELDENGIYFVRIFQKAENSSPKPESDDDFVEVDRFVPRPTGKPINYIPFVPLGPVNLRFETSKPTLLDMADMNINLWKFSCDLSQACHKLAFPVPVLSGVDASEGAVWEVGGDQVWQLPAGATANMLEMHGDGFGALERAIDRTENYMAHLGARVLGDEKRVTETAEAISMRNSGETSTLANISRTVGDGFQMVIRWAAQWESDNPKDVVVELNQDFRDAGMSSQEMLALATLYNQRLITLEDVIWNLQRGERLRPGRTPEEIATELENTPPMLLGQAMPLEEAQLEDEPQSAPGGIQTETKVPRNGRSMT